MTLAQLESAQKRMQQKWYDLAMAEQRGVALPVLERMYNAYVLAMEEYNRRSEEYQREIQGESGENGENGESSPGAVKRKKAAGLKGNATPVDGSQNRRAS
jgi:hypothetical protein